VSGTDEEKDEALLKEKLMVHRLLDEKVAASEVVDPHHLGLIL